MTHDTYINGQAFPGMGPHDIGNVPPTDEPIDTVDHGMAYWEKHANALRMAISRHAHLGTLDEMRRATEELGERYYQLSYFERQTESLAAVLTERGYLTDARLRARMAEIEKRFNETPILDLPAKPKNHPHDDHDHDVEWKEDERGEGYGQYHLMNLAIQELLQEQGELQADEVRYMLENFDGDFPNRGPKVAARAWVDPEFKNHLLEDALPAIEGMGFDMEFQARVIVLENTPQVHNVVVCTLCSCYPRFLMGQPPSWYKSRSYRSRVVHDPRAVLKEFGTVLPDDVTIRVHDSNADMRYMVLPVRPEGTEGWSEAELEGLITRDCLVGVTLPKGPA